ncbi:MAG: ImuA family protein [Hyphomicrobiaceae bacterium]
MKCLRQHIADIESKSVPGFAAGSGFVARSRGDLKSLGHACVQTEARALNSDATWRLGLRELDDRLGLHGLDMSGVHEIKPHQPQVGSVAVADHAIATAFAFRLVARLRHAQKQQRNSGVVAKRPVLICFSQATRFDLGRVYGPGLQRLGFQPSDIIIVEAPRPRDNLWAIEEGLKSGAVGAVIGHCEDVALTPARRLSLAAATHVTPCLMITSARAPVMGATSSRWRVGASSAKLALKSGIARTAMTPSHKTHFLARYDVCLERCRGQMSVLGAPPVTLEWSDETHGFRLAAGLANRAPTPRQQKVRTA